MSIKLNNKDVCDGLCFLHSLSLNDKRYESQTKTFYEIFNYIKKLEEKVEKTKWIPCSERLPEKSDAYLITCKGYDENYVDFIDYGYAYGKDKEMSFYEWDDEYWNCYQPKPIAWMPLPEPYKESSNEENNNRD